MIRRRSTPWIQRWSRHLIGAIAILGVLETTYLTITKLTGGSVVCPTTGCEQVLSSPYAIVFGLPLTLFGLLAYASMATLALGPLAIDAEAKKELHSQVENTTWLVMFALATAMVISSGYLMYIMAFKLQALCVYCVTSATFTLLFFLLTLIGRAWEDLGQLFFTGIVVGMIALIGAVGIYANVDGTAAQSDHPTETSTPGGELGPPIVNVSGSAEIELARHLSNIGAKEYGAFWCPHCHEQKELFGKEAAALINYVECDPRGKNGKPELCKKAEIKGFPTWKMNGQTYEGVQPLEKLANLTGYKGRRDFLR